MTRRVLLSLSLLAAFALVGLTQTPVEKKGDAKQPETKPAAGKVKSTLKVTVPQEDAELTIDEQAE